MNITFLPRSAPGWWAVGLCVSSLAVFILAELLIGFSGAGEEANLSLARGITALPASLQYSSALSAPRF